MKPMTTKQAWRLFAKEFAKVANGGPSKIAQYYGEDTGLCISLSILHGDGRITGSQAIEMEDQLQSLTAAPDRPVVYYWTRDAEGAAARSVAAMLLAEGAL